MIANLNKTIGGWDPESGIGWEVAAPARARPFNVYERYSPGAPELSQAERI